MRSMQRLWTDEQGTDLVEYSLLLAFICLASAAAFLGVGTNVNILWAVTNNRLASAANAASGSS